MTDGKPFPNASRSESPRVAIILGYGQDACRWAAHNSSGTVRDSTPYSYHLAGGRFSLTWSVDHPENPIQRSWRRLVRRLAGTDIVHVWRNRGLLTTADAVWTHTEKEHLAVVFVLQMMGCKNRPKILGQSVWLWDTWGRRSRIWRWWASRLLAKLDVEVVHSTWNLERSRTSVPNRRVVRLPFGTSGPPRSDPPSGGYVLAIGNDIHRDWALLARAAELTPEVSYVVASPSRRAERTHWPPNVQLTCARGVAECDAQYYGASLVVLPLKTNLHASGATVCIEAAAANRPLLAVDTGGVDEYVRAVGGSLVQAGDAHLLAAEIRRTLSMPSLASATMTRPESVGLSSEDYVTRYMWLTEMLLGKCTWNESITMFTPVGRQPTNGSVS